MTVCYFSGHWLNVIEYLWDAKERDILSINVHLKNLQNCVIKHGPEPQRNAKKN